MLNNVKFQTENNIVKEELVQVKYGDVSEYRLKIELEEECSPKVYSIIWEEEQIDMYGFWSSKSSHQHNLTPDWGMRTNESRTATGMPLACIYSKANKNRVTVALSDPASPSNIMVGVVEENGCLRFQIDLFSQICPKMKEYEVVIRIDRRPIPLSKAVTDTRAWWSDLGYKCAHVPKYSCLPMYSTWYSFHQSTIPEEIIYECKIAKEYGMDTVIVDDGWQTDDNSRGYAFCGDWRVCEKKIPDMRDFVEKIHALGMKFIIWFSVPFVGFESENYERFKGKYLHTRERINASVLDPRFPDVREFLVNTYCENVKKYNWDGLKLDFIDSFRLGEESSECYDQMDCISVEEGLQRLLSEATAELKKINPEIMIEFRQSYVGPIVGQYGNIFRVADCPNDAIYNRTGSLDLRLTSGDIPVHSDMLMWNKNDTNESVMYQLLATMFCVPQISIRFDNITGEHKALLKNYLSFWRKHRDVILKGELTLEGIDADYTMAKAQKDGTCVAVLYQNTVLKVDNNEVTYVFNSVGDDGIYIEAEEDKKYEIYDIFGNKYASGAISRGIHKIDTKNCEMLCLKGVKSEED